MRCQPRRADEQRRDRVLEPVLLRLGFEAQRAADRLDQVLLSFDDVLPRRGQGVLEVCHEDVRPAIERVDHHLARDGAGDLHPSPLEVGRRGGDLPLGRPNLGGVGEKVGLGAGVERGLSGDAVVEQRLASRVEGRVEIGHEGQRPRGQNGVGRRRSVSR